MEDIKKIENQCFLDKNTPIPVLYVCIKDKKHYIGVAVPKPDETTQWFYLIAQILKSNFNNLPDVSLCKQFSDLKGKKQVFVPKIIELINAPKKIPKKIGCNCNKNKSDSFSKIETFADYVKATRDLKQKDGCFCHKDEICFSKYDDNNKYKKRTDKLKELVHFDYVSHKIPFVAIEYWDEGTQKMDHYVQIFKDVCTKLPEHVRKFALVAHLLNGGTFENYNEFQPNDDVIIDFIKTNDLK